MPLGENEIPSEKRLIGFPVLGAIANNTIIQFISAQGAFLIRTMAQLKADLAIALNDLVDVDVPTPNNGDVLTFNSTSGNWEPLASDGGLGDLEFLSDKELSGDLIKVQGNRTTAGVVTSVTPATGKTFFHVKSSASIGTTPAATKTIELRNDGTNREVRFLAQNPATTGADELNTDFESVKCDSLVGNSAKVYDVNVSATSGVAPVHATILGWIQDT